MANKELVLQCRQDCWYDIEKFVNKNKIKKQDIQQIVYGGDGDFYLFYWKDVKVSGDEQ